MASPVMANPVELSQAQVTPIMVEEEEVNDSRCCDITKKVVKIMAGIILGTLGVLAVAALALSIALLIFPGLGTHLTASAVALGALIAKGSAWIVNNPVIISIASSIVLGVVGAIGTTILVVQHSNCTEDNVDIIEGEGGNPDAIHELNV